MATVKQLLNESMKRLGSRGAMPNDSSAITVHEEKNVTESESKWDIDLLKYVCPSDGYLTAKLETSDPSMRIVVRNNDQQCRNSGYNATAIIPAKKGSYCALDIMRVKDAVVSSFVLKFYKTIGGGLNSFINSVVASLSGVRYGLA